MAEFFLRLDLDTLEHPKLLRLTAQYSDRGYVSLQRLWIHAAKFNRDGRFDDLSSTELAAIARAPGKPPEQFIDFLVALKLLDREGETLVIHNWAQRQPFIATARERSERNTKNAINRWSHRGEPADEPNDSSAGAETKREQAQALVDSWNATVKRLPKVEKLTAQRIAHACARLKEHTREELGTLFKRLDDSDLAAKGWGSFDWITKSEDNLTKLREGNYDNHRGTNGAAARPMPTGAEYLESAGGPDIEREPDILLRVPPQDVEAEMSVLGAILLDNDSIDRAGEIVQVEDFYRERHRQIFQAMLDLASARKPIDPLRFPRSSEAKRSWKSAVRGYLAELAAFVPTARNIAHYARAVHDAAILRDASSALTALASDAYEARDVSEFLANLEYEMARVLAKQLRQPEPSKAIDARNCALENRARPRGLRASGFAPLDQCFRRFQCRAPDDACRAHEPRENSARD